MFVTYLKEEEMSAFNDFLHNATSTLLCSPRIQHVTYVALPGSFFHSNYPINILRNLGIRQVRTSHFLLLDMDMWLSGIPPSHSLIHRPVLRSPPGFASCDLAGPQGCRGNSSVVPHGLDHRQRHAAGAGELVGLRRCAEK